MVHFILKGELERRVKTDAYRADTRVGSILKSIIAKHYEREDFLKNKEGENGKEKEGSQGGREEAVEG